MYSKKEAYTDQWGANKVGFAIQVLYPPRQLTVPKVVISEVFKKNWDSEVRVQKYSCGSSKAENFAKDGDLIISTQGRLYKTMWAGDLQYLDMGSKAPIMPTIDTRSSVKLIEVTPRIKEGGMVTQERVTTTYVRNTKSMALKKSDGKVVFAMPYDRSNSVSLKKFIKVRDALNRDLDKKPLFLTPKQAGIDDWKLFLPTIYLALLITPKLTVEELYEKVKKVTYVKAKDGKKNNYDISRHGEIFRS